MHQKQNQEKNIVSEITILYKITIYVVNCFCLFVSYFNSFLIAVT